MVNQLTYCRQNSHNTTDPLGHISYPLLHHRHPDTPNPTPTAKKKKKTPSKATPIKRPFPFHSWAAQTFSSGGRRQRQETDAIKVKAGTCRLCIWCSVGTSYVDVKWYLQLVDHFPKPARTTFGISELAVLMMEGRNPCISSFPARRIGRSPFTNGMCASYPGDTISHYAFTRQLLHTQPRWFYMSCSRADFRCLDTTHPIRNLWYYILSPSSQHPNPTTLIPRNQQDIVYDVSIPPPTRIRNNPSPTLISHSTSPVSSPPPKTAVAPAASPTPISAPQSLANENNENPSWRRNTLAFTMVLGLGRQAWYTMTSYPAAEVEHPARVTPRGSGRERWWRRAWLVG